MWARLLLRNVKIPLPVDVCRSKTPLLKFSIGQSFSLSQVTIPEVFAKANLAQCRSHIDMGIGLLPQKGKRDLNGEQSCTVTVIKEVYSSKCCPATFHLSMWLA